MGDLLAMADRLDGEYEEAYYSRVPLRPAGGDHAILRSNTRARMMNTHPEVHPRQEGTGVWLLE